MKKLMALKSFVACAAVCGCVAVCNAKTAEIDPPKGSARAEYIESSGHQYINTLQPMSANDRIECKFELVVGQMYPYGSLFGAADSSGGVYAFMPYYNWVSPRYVANGKNYVYRNAQLPYGVPLVLKVEGSSVAFDGHWLSGSISCEPDVALIDSASYLTLFTYNKATTMGEVVTDHNDGSGLYARLYDFAIYNEDELQRHFVPVIKDVGTESEEFGLWETVEGKFFGNADPSAGPFTGEVLVVQEKKLPSEYAAADYIESTNHQVIRTDLMFDQLYEVDCKFSMMSQQPYPFSFLYGMLDEKGDHMGFQPMWSWPIWSKNSVHYYVAGGDIKWDSSLPCDTVLSLFAGGWVCRVTQEDGTVCAEFWSNSDPRNAACPMAIFAENKGGTADEFKPDLDSTYTGSAIRLYDFKVTRNGCLVAHFIPCCKDRGKATQEFGLWETVEGKFHGDANPLEADEKGFLGQISKGHGLIILVQ